MQFTKKPTRFTKLNFLMKRKDLSYASRRNLRQVRKSDAIRKKFAAIRKKLLEVLYLLADLFNGKCENLTRFAKNPTRFAKNYSKFCTCSRIFSSSPFILTTIRAMRALLAFDPMVLVSRFNSCIRKSSFLPDGSFAAAIS